jgi:hypothetical protein
MVLEGLILQAVATDQDSPGKCHFETRARAAREFACMDRCLMLQRTRTLLPSRQASWTFQHFNFR